MLAGELDERLHRRRLLRGLLAGADAAATGPTGDRDLRDELLRVIGPARLDQRVGGRLAEEALGELLELGLVVALSGGRVPCRVDGEVRLDHRARRLEPRVEVDGAEDRLVRGGENRRLLASPATLLTLPEPE